MAHIFQKIKGLIFLFIFVTFIPGALSQGHFPESPITFYVHSRPGSAIDITTRQLTRIAAKYSDITLLVENKTGGSGVVAMQHVLNKEADGYSVLAMTKSFISTILLTSSENNLNDFQYLSAMVVDPEVLITNRNNKVHTFQQILDDAVEKKGKQKWLGPLVGGVDHLMALKTWDYLKIRGEWIPFEGGSDALASLLGQHGTVYVGNPVDIMGRPDLMIAVVAAPERLRDFPLVPTFEEMGYDIKSEILWRGYVAKKGIPNEALSYLIDLFKKVSEDPEWIRFVRQSGAENVLITENDFLQMVKHDQKETLIYLHKEGLINDNANEKVLSTFVNGLISIVLFLIILLFLYFVKRPLFNGEVIIPVSLLFISLFLFIETLSFPAGKLGGSAGPAVMPRLWISGMILFSLWLLFGKKSELKTTEEESLNLRKALSLAILMGFYIIATGILGFYLSTFIFILLGVYLLSYKRYWVALLFSAGFVAFSYLVFKTILMVPLPTGIFG